MKPTPLIVLLLLFLFSCKKNGDVNPSPNAVDDLYLMYDPDTVKICPVLENDHYTGKAIIPDFGYIAIYGKFEVIDPDSAILFTPFKNAYGNFDCTYTFNDKNGSAKGHLRVKRGTDAQITTSNIISQFANRSIDPSPDEQVYYLYAIDGDTSYFYHNTDYEYVQFNLKSEIEINSSHLPTIESNIMYYDYYNEANYSIDTDGIIHATDTSDNEVSLKMLGTFSDIAKKPDLSGNLQVRGFTIGYNGKVYDFAIAYELN
ncbi:MAG: hypothetical protein JWM14_1449 [Chitinophagaceae bacterium]|nr:hypothetical protein [Chitinophagaceae bacterium]